MRRFLAGRLGRPDRRSHRAELRGLPAGVLGRRAPVGIDEVSLLDVGVAQLNQQACVLPFQERTGNSASPEVDALARVLGDLCVDHDVGELEPASGLEDPVDLGEHRILVRDQIDDAVRDHDVDFGVR
jgi:hypothetical protein